MYIYKLCNTNLAITWTQRNFRRICSNVLCI